MKKNDRIELKITDMGVNGEGIGKFEGCTFFVKDAVIGDTVKAVITKMKKGYGYAKMVEVSEASPFRVTPPCPEARRCGGCQIMEMDYQEQLRFKQQKVENNLKKIGGLKDFRMLPIIGMDREPVRYRNKMQFPVGRDRDGNIAAGFYAGRTHYIIDTEDCRIAPEVCSEILQCVKNFIRKNEISVYNENTGQGLVRHLVLRVGFHSGEIMVCLVLNGKSLNEGNYRKSVDHEAEFVQVLSGLSLKGSCKEGLTPDFQITSICINTNTEDTNVILGKNIRCLYGQPFIYDEIEDPDSKERLKFKISPLSFYQVNPEQTEKLYAKALEFAELKGKETVWDLYCGIGTISLFLAKKAKLVRGVEIVPEAIQDAKENAALNGIRNAEFFCGKSEEVFPTFMKSRMPEEEPENEIVVVLDPPRKGCDRILLDTLLEEGPERIVYVSCDSATLARDLKILTSGEGKPFRYKVEKVQPADMFPNSVHCESVVKLTLKKNVNI